MNPQTESPTPLIPTQQISLGITGMTCANCAATIQRTLEKKTPGVVEAHVNLAAEKAAVRYQPDQVTPEALIEAIQRIGYGAVQSVAGQLRSGTTAAQDELSRQQRQFWVGVCFSLPLFALSMARDFGVLGAWAHAPWVNWLMLVLATPVQFYVGWDYYRGSWKALRNFTANMDVLIALGSSAAYFYSLPVTVALTLGQTGLGAHVYYETAAAIITLIKLGKLLEGPCQREDQRCHPKADGVATPDRLGGEAGERAAGAAGRGGGGGPTGGAARGQGRRGWTGDGGEFQPG